MIPNTLFRPLLGALTGLIFLVGLCVVLLATSAFLLPWEEPPANLECKGHGKPNVAVVKQVALTSQQLAGKALFENNCAQCHSTTTDILVGPGLIGVQSRTPDQDWLFKWIRNPSAVVASGDPYAVQLYKSFNKVPMPGFATLTDAQIKSILAYVDPSYPASGTTSEAR